LCSLPAKQGTSLNPTELAGNYPIITAAAAAAQGVPATSARYVDDPFSVGSF